MPQLQTIALTDRSTPTPVVHTFTPLDISQQGVGTAIETTGTPVGNPSISVSCKRGGDRYRAEVRLAMPVVQNETISGIVKPKVVRTAYANLQFNFSAESSEQERTNLVGMLADSLGTGKVLVNDAVVKLQGVY